MLGPPRRRGTIFGRYCPDSFVRYIKQHLARSAGTSHRAATHAGAGQDPRQGPFHPGAPTTNRAAPHPEAARARASM